MKRTLGAAIGAVIFILFMAIAANRLTPPAAAAPSAPSGPAVASAVNP